MNKSMRDYSKLKGNWKTILLITIIVVSFLLRVSPLIFNREHLIGVDTGHILDSALNILKTGDLNPHDFHYGSLAIYLVSAFLFILKTVGVNIYSNSLWYANFLSVIVGTLSIFFLYKLGKQIKDEKLGLILAGLVCFLPFHIFRSTFTNGDVFGQLFTVIALIYIVKIYKDESYKQKDYILAGLFTGFAAASKLNYAFLLVFFILFYFIDSKFSWFKKLFRGKIVLPKGLVFYGLAVVLAFVITSPFVLIDFSDFKSVQEYNVYHLEEGSHRGQNSYATGSLFKFPYGDDSFLMIPLVFLPIGLGIGYFILFIFSLIYIFSKKKYKNSFILSNIIYLFIMWVYLGRFVVMAPRYVFPLFIFIAILIGYFVHNNLSKKWIAILIGVLFLYNAVLSISISSSYLHSSGYELEEWKTDNLSPDEISALNNLKISDSGQVAPAVWKYRIKAEEIVRIMPEYLVFDKYNLNTHLLDPSLDPTGQSETFVKRLLAGIEPYKLIEKIERPYITRSWYQFLHRRWETYGYGNWDYYIFQRTA
ncbi:glycosyltransferase family 39 protein [Nanoarchaeota archaeon]